MSSLKLVTPLLLGVAGSVMIEVSPIVAAEKSRFTIETLTTKYAGIGLLKQSALSDAIGDHSWSADLEEGLLTFNGLTSHPIQVLGTESELSQTWLWEWTRSDSPPTIQKASLALRKLGKEHKIKEFTTRKLLSLDRLSGHQIALIATGYLDAGSYYRGPYAGGAVYLLLVDYPPASEVEKGHVDAPVPARDVASRARAPAGARAS